MQVLKSVKRNRACSHMLQALNCVAGSTLHSCLRYPWFAWEMESTVTMEDPPEAKLSVTLSPSL